MPTGESCSRPLVLPDFRDYAVPIEKPGRTSTEPTRILGQFLRDVIARQPRTRSA